MIQLTRNKKSKCRSYRSSKHLPTIEEDEVLDTSFNDTKLVDELQQNVLSDIEYKYRIPFFKQQQHENFTNETNFKEKILKLKQIYIDICLQIIIPENNHPNLKAMLKRIGSHIKKQYNNALTKLSKTDQLEMPQLDKLPN